MRCSIVGATVEQVKDVGGSEIKEARNAGIIFARLTDKQVTKLRSIGCVVKIVGRVKAAVMPPVPVTAAPVYTPEQLSVAAGYDVVRTMMSPPLSGSGFNVAIIDSGVRETHERLGGRVVYSKNFTDSPMRDGFNHGTACASIVVALAPLCNLLNFKVLDDDGAGTEEEVVMAIDRAVSLLDDQPEIAPHVINLSLGTEDNGDPDSPLRVVSRAAIERSIWIFAAAGNDGPQPGTIMSPACERYVGAVGSIGYEPFTISQFSSRGPTVEGLIKPDAVLFGESIVMASSASDTATTAKSGTSFAAPFGSAMGIITHEGMYRRATLTTPISGITYREAWAMTVQDLLDTYLPLIGVKPEGSSQGKDNDYGYGLPFGPRMAQVIQPTMGIPSALPVFLALAMIPVVMKVAE